MQYPIVRYIELNPVRAGMVDHPAKYRWSSYATNTLGVSNAILAVQAEYMALGRLPDDRQTVYRGLFDGELDSDELALLRCVLCKRERRWVMRSSKQKLKRHWIGEFTLQPHHIFDLTPYTEICIVEP